TDLCRVRARLRELPLEQFSVAADRHQFGRGAAANGRIAGIRVDRPGHRLVDHLRRHADDLGTAPAGFSAVPAPVHPELPARRHKVTWAFADLWTSRLELKPGRVALNASRPAFVLWEFVALGSALIVTASGGFALTPSADWSAVSRTTRV